MVILNSRLQDAPIEALTRFYGCFYKQATPRSSFVPPLKLRRHAVGLPDFLLS